MATPQQDTAVPLWVRGLRANLLGSIGRPWSVSPMRGKAKLFVRFSDGSRRSVVLPYAWVPAQARDIQAAAEQIAAQLAAGIPLAEAAAPFTGNAGAAPPPPIAGGDLLAAWEAFGHHKVTTGAIKPTTWAKDYRPSAERLAEVHSRATTAKELLTAIGEQWPAGARRRQIAVQHVAAMLRWACDEDQLPADRWTPPTSLRRFTGEALPTTEAAVPLTDQQILDLLDGLPTDAAGGRWRFVFQLLAAYGLRPVEVQHLQPRHDGQLWCTYQKRSGGGTTRPRALRALHPEWEAEWALRERLAAGEAMPPFGGGVADAARRYLARQDAWAPLAAAGITPYGFRHGYSLRAHQSYGLSPRITAALMGHSIETHQRVYGTWADSDTIDGAIAAGLRYRDIAQATYHAVR
jgi:integrase